MVKADCGYKSVGPTESTYREGNSTIQFSVVNATATYNTTTNEPNPPSKKGRFAKRKAESSQFGKVMLPVKLS